MFFGYESETQMRQRNPRLADHLIATARRSPTNVCTRGKACLGSVDGTIYLYADGSQDTGQTIINCRAEHAGHVFAWPEGQP